MFIPNTPIETVVMDLCSQHVDQRNKILAKSKEAWIFECKSLHFGKEVVPKCIVDTCESLSRAEYEYRKVLILDGKWL